MRNKSCYFLLAFVYAVFCATLGCISEHLHAQTPTGLFTTRLSLPQLLRGTFNLAELLMVAFL